MGGDPADHVYSSGPISKGWILFAWRCRSHTTGLMEELVIINNWLVAIMYGPRSANSTQRLKCY